MMTATSTRVPLDAPLEKRPSKEVEVAGSYRGTRLRAMRIEDELWAAAKAKAAEDGTSVNAAVREFLESWTTPPKKPAKKAAAKKAAAKATPRKR